MEEALGCERLPGRLLQEQDQGFKYASWTSRSTKTFSKLKRGVRYYVKIRAYRTIDGTRVYGMWSTTKSAKVK